MRRRARICAAPLVAALAAAAPPASAAQAPAPASTPAPRVGPSPGEPAPSFDVESLVGTVAPVEYARSGPTVLLFFLASCPHCKQMIPRWNAAFEKRPAGVKVLGIMLDREPPGYFQLVPIAFPVVHAVDPRGTSRLFKVTKVPLTVRVGADHTVEDAEAGELAEARLAQLFGK